MRKNRFKIVGVTQKEKITQSVVFSFCLLLIESTQRHRDLQPHAHPIELRSYLFAPTRQSEVRALFGILGE